MGMILHMETSGPYCSVAIAKDGKQLALVEYPTVNAHAQQITLVIDEALKQSNTTIDDIEAIAISEGPGSYTGLRVSASAAKGICYARSLPMIAISTLHSLADAAMLLSPDPDAVFIPMIDARRMEVYTAIFDGNGNVIADPFAKIIDETGYGDVVTVKGKKKIFSGSGVEKCTDILKGDDVILYDDLTCRADNLIRLANQKFMAKDYVDIAYFKPLYLKSPNITKSRPLL